MKNVLITILSLLFCLGILAQPKGTSTETLLKRAVDEKHCVGIAAGVIKNDSILWSSSAGLKDISSSEKFQINTISRTASITKPMTAIAIMQLEEQGKLNLNDPLSNYLDTSGNEQLNKISILHLLQHSSGITEYKNKKEALNSTNYATLEAAADVFIGRDLRFEPGTDFGYTSYGYVLLGIIIEKASGMSYESYVKTNIWDVAGMTDTSVEKNGNRSDRISSYYHQKKPGKIISAMESNLSNRIPGGGVQSTVEDLLKFGAAVLNNSLIKAETFDRMIKNSGLKKEGNGYGLGWYLYGMNPKYGNVVGHNGAQMGCSSFLFLLPEYNTCVAVIANTSGALQQVGNAAVSMFEFAGE